VKLEFGRDEEAALFAAANLGVTILPPFTGLLITNDAGEIGGAIVYTNYTGANIEVTVYVPALYKRGLIRAALAYPFRQLQVLRLSARTRRDNKAVCSILPRMGFVYEGTMKRYFGPARSDDAIMYRLDCETASKWI
jgi:RimJ/RimL family protein N-acetyltransferase